MRSGAAGSIGIAILGLGLLGCGGTEPIPIEVGGLESYDAAVRRSEGDRPLLVNHFALWCEPCMLEMPYLLQRASAYEGRIDFLFVSWDLTVEKDREALLSRLRDFARERSLRHPIFVYDGPYDLLLTKAGTTKNAIPFTLLYGTDGKIAYRFEMPFLTDEAKAGLELALGEMSGGGEPAGS